MSIPTTNPMLCARMLATRSRLHHSGLVDHKSCGKDLPLLGHLLRDIHPTDDERIVVATSRGATVLSVSDIDWIETAGNYVQLWIGPRSYFLRESLQVLEERVRKHGFIRAHRRALVRLDGVRELTRGPRGRAGCSPRQRCAHPDLASPKRGIRGSREAAWQRELRSLPLAVLISPAVSQVPALHTLPMQLNRRRRAGSIQ